MLLISLLCSLIVNLWLSYRLRKKPKRVAIQGVFTPAYKNEDGSKNRVEHKFSTKKLKGGI